jgi:ABC-type protease/lipase transport system fused ATPase/permease subunit
MISIVNYTKKIAMWLHEPFSTDGYDTLLDEAFKGGQELSTGQWQRVAVARGFYRMRRR